MKAAAWPRGADDPTRLLWIDPSVGTFGDGRGGDLPGRLRAGDLVVVNDAATIPASLQGTVSDGRAIEVRLFAQDGKSWQAIAFGEGDWRTDTEQRPAPPALSPGDRLRFGDRLSATVKRVPHARRIDLEFDQTGAAFWSALYAHGRPIQYAYVRAPLPLYEVVTAYAARPWAAEMPSAGRPITASLFASFRARGVAVAALTHAAGLSSTGDPTLDATLPWPERYEIPESTASAVASAHARGGRVLAVGTTVVRALESAATDRGLVRAGEGVAELRIGPRTEFRVVDGLLTGLHDAGASHFSLLQAFAPRPLLERAYEHAEGKGFLAHELGDACVILPSG